MHSNSYSIFSYTYLVKVACISRYRIILSFLVKEILRYVCIYIFKKSINYSLCDWIINKNLLQCDLIYVYYDNPSLTVPHQVCICKHFVVVFFQGSLNRKEIWLQCYWQLRFINVTRFPNERIYIKKYPGEWKLFE